MDDHKGHIIIYSCWFYSLIKLYIPKWWHDWAELDLNTEIFRTRTKEWRSEYYCTSESRRSSVVHVTLICDRVLGILPTIHQSINANCRNLVTLMEYYNNNNSTLAKYLFCAPLFCCSFLYGGKPNESFVMWFQSKQASWSRNAIGYYSTNKN